MTALIALLGGAGLRQRIRLLILSGLAGIGNVGVLAGINSAASEPSMAGGARTLVLILLLVGLYRVTQFAVMSSAGREVEVILHRTRGALVEQVLEADLQALEAIGRQDLFSGIARCTQTISESLTVLLVGAQSAVMILFALLYIGTLSLPAFLLTAFFIAVTLAAQWFSMRRSRSDLDDAIAAESGLFRDVDDLLGGFKEVRMNLARAQALLAQIRGRTAGTASAMSRIRRRTADHFVFGQASLLLLLGATVFAVPLVASSYSPVIIKVTTAILFVIGSVGLLVQSGPVLVRADEAAAGIARLSGRLRAAARPSGGLECPPDASSTGFDALSLDDVEFRYPMQGNEAGFAVGPLHLAIRRHEIVFITGGNGTGKTTLIRLITGLYHPAAGRVWLDRLQTPAGQQTCTSPIAAVFGDYHLFSRLYVMPSGGRRRIEDELESMELSDKVSLDGDAFSSLDLSAGQRRRIALLMALLQDRPILMLDEVAADFDPEFRRRFYEEMLPALRDAGKTIIAASHDDRYFHVADRILKLEDGRIRELDRSPA